MRRRNFVYVCWHIVLLISKTNPQWQMFRRNGLKHTATWSISWYINYKWKKPCYNKTMVKKSRPFVWKGPIFERARAHTRLRCVAVCEKVDTGRQWSINSERGCKLHVECSSQATRLHPLRMMRHTRVEGIVMLEKEGNVILLYYYYYYYLSWRKEKNDEESIRLCVWVTGE